MQMDVCRTKRQLEYMATCFVVQIMTMTCQANTSNQNRISKMKDVSNKIQYKTQQMKNNSEFFFWTFFFVFFNDLCPCFSIDIFILSAVGFEFANRRKKMHLNSDIYLCPYLFGEKFIYRNRDNVGCIIKYYFDCAVGLNYWFMQNTWWPCLTCEWANNLIFLFTQWTNLQLIFSENVWETWR